MAALVWRRAVEHLLLVQRLDLAVACLVVRPNALQKRLERAARCLQREMLRPVLLRKKTEVQCLLTPRPLIPQLQPHTADTRPLWPARKFRHTDKSSYVACGGQRDRNTQTHTQLAKSEAAQREMEDEIVPPHRTDGRRRRRNIKV